MLIKFIRPLMVLSVVFFMAACAKPAVVERVITNNTSSQIKVHINQVAFEINGPKIAIISSDIPLSLSGTLFNIVDGGVSLFQGKLTKHPHFDEWKAAYKNGKNQQYFYQAVFSNLSKEGDFNLQIKTRDSVVVSSPFSIGKQVLFRQTVSAMLDYFNGSRNDQDYNFEQDKNIRIFDTDRYVDVSGGWNDAGGDSGKYLSHLSYSNYLNPQQLAHVGWALAYSYQRVPKIYQELGLSEKVIEEVFWGADYLHRILDEKGYFYMTVFDQWNTNNAERVITAYVGPDGTYTQDYQSAFRQGAGSAIAALARAYMLTKETGKHGQYTGQQYLDDAERAFKHLEANKARNNKAYTDNGEENIIDDYTALLAATELYRATKNEYYLVAARGRATNLALRVTDEGWFISNNIDSDNLRPFYHAAEAGFPIVSLSEYLTIETEKSKISQAKSVIRKHLSYQLQLNNKVSNPFNYARQPFKVYKDEALSTELQSGFFIPHANETNYWWQGESARLSSLAMAAVIGGRAVSEVKQFSTENFGINAELAIFAQNQIDWTLGRNPYDLCMLNGFGVNNPAPYDGLSMVYGGISNGITGTKTSAEGRGIEFGPEPDWQNWRWVEQWLPHSTWFLLATTEMAIKSK